MPKAPDLAVNFAGIRSPNPFWLASARRPTAASRSCGLRRGRRRVCEDDRRADRHAARAYSSIDWNGQRMMGLNNID